MEDQYWTYRTIFKVEDIGENERLYFHSEGIDYQFHIIINGEKVYEHEGMFSSVDVDLTDHLHNDNELYITVFPVPTSAQISESSPDWMK